MANIGSIVGSQPRHMWSCLNKRKEKKMALWSSTFCRTFWLKFTGFHSSAWREVRLPLAHLSFYLCRDVLRCQLLLPFAYFELVLLLAGSFWGQTCPTIPSVCWSVFCRKKIQELLLVSLLEGHQMQLLLHFDLRSSSLFWEKFEREFSKHLFPRPDTLLDS